MFNYSQSLIYFRRIKIFCTVYFDSISHTNKYCLPSLRGKKKVGGGGKKGGLAAAAKKAAIAKKMAKMTKEEKANYKKGKRDPESDSDYSYRSYVSDGGTRHVARRRKRGDGTYSAEHSYHSSQVPKMYA